MPTKVDQSKRAVLEFFLRSNQHRRQPLLVDDQHVIEQPQSGSRVADLGPEAGKRDQDLRMDGRVSRGLRVAQRPLAHFDGGRGSALIAELQRKP